jgi:hypothetical protein
MAAKNPRSTIRSWIENSIGRSLTENETESGVVFHSGFLNFDALIRGISRISRYEKMAKALAEWDKKYHDTKV